MELLLHIPHYMVACALHHYSAVTLKMNCSAQHQRIRLYAYTGSLHGFT